MAGLHGGEAHQRLVGLSRPAAVFFYDPTAPAEDVFEATSFLLTAKLPNRPNESLKWLFIKISGRATCFHHSHKASFVS